ncbi:hypothetical protein Drorol1_Dr00007677 [Drosera rotundifolia]
MDSSPNSLLPPKKALTTYTTTTSRWPISRHGISLRRRRKIPRERLGDKKKPFLVRVFRSLRFRSLRLRRLRLQYSCLFKKLKEHYGNVIREMIEASASLEVMQQRVSMEMTMTVPVMGIAFSGYPAGGR